MVDGRHSTRRAVRDGQASLVSEADADRATSSQRSKRAQSQKNGKPSGAAAQPKRKRDQGDDASPAKKTKKIAKPKSSRKAPAKKGPVAQKPAKEQAPVSQEMQAQSDAPFQTGVEAKQQPAKPSAVVRDTVPAAGNTAQTGMTLGTLSPEAIARIDAGLKNKLAASRDLPVTKCPPPGRGEAGLGLSVSELPPPPGRIPGTPLDPLVCALSAPGEDAKKPLSGQSSTEEDAAKAQPESEQQVELSATTTESLSVDSKAASPSPPCDRPASPQHATFSPIDAPESDTIPPDYKDSAISAIYTAASPAQVASPHAPTTPADYIPSPKHSSASPPYTPTTPLAYSAIPPGNEHTSPLLADQGEPGTAASLRGHDDPGTDVGEDFSSLFGDATPPVNTQAKLEVKPVPLALPKAAPKPAQPNPVVDDPMRLGIQLPGLGLTRPYPAPLSTSNATTAAAKMVPGEDSDFAGYGSDYRIPYVEESDADSE
ncbi:hypothetical protein B0A55_03994 [Friedmanniomyces simplex]|uniref:Uncharacterized protein n=1 Tax=Friedmanniomyces simplex TaxID=329884 RepID=A0A4U0XKD8_9PEZI|nr:hypothetical protein B0A55_03994 [Friedmanniomyces simplex]